jgi:PKD repeat protein
MISATASAPESATVVKVVTVTAGSSPFEVLASPQRGIAPHPVDFTIVSRTGLGIDRIDVDFGGTGTIGFTTSDSGAPIQTTYGSPGVYMPKVTVTDTDGGAHEFTSVIVVNSVGSLDTKLRAIYAGMLARLRAGDTEGALKSFAPGAVEIYRPVFQALLPTIATVADQLGTIADGSIIEGLAEYVLVQDTSQGKQAFLMYLTQGSDGTWLISSL